MRESNIDITSIQVSWPVLCVKEEEYFVFNSSDEMVHTSRELLLSGIFKGVTVIDSNGNQYEITSATELKPANIFGGVSLLKKGHQIIATIKLKEVGKITLSQLLDIASKESKRNALIQEKVILIPDNTTYENVIRLFE